MYYRFAHLHGFSSSSTSSKGLAIQAVLKERGCHVHLPDLNVPSFSELTFSGALGVLDELHRATGGADGGPWRVSGSSMGAYLAALWAELHPERVERLLLLAPAFGLTQRWQEIMGEPVLTRWRERGSHEFPDHSGKPTAVHWGFIENALQHPPAPRPQCEMRIVHGRNDTVIPCAWSRDYVAEQGQATLIEVDDGHSLMASLPMLKEQALSYLAGA